MLFVKLRLLLADRTTRLQTLEIGRVQGGAVGDYIVRERNHQGEVIAHSQLLQYPRWSEHASGLAARCAHALWFSDASEGCQPAPADDRIERAWMDLAIGSFAEGVRKEVERSEFIRSGFAPRLLVVREHWPAAAVPVPSSLPTDTRAVLLCFLAISAWGASDIPRMPRPLSVPIYREFGTPVIRFSDVPEPARTAFDARMSYRTCPVVPELGDCAYLWDWQSFLGEA